MLIYVLSGEEMKYKIIIIVIAVIFVAGMIGSILVMNSPARETVRIISDSEVLYTIDLATAEDRMIDIEYQGHVNTVEIRDHRIRVKSADCPDRTCVNMGWLTGSAMPIVCLPHHLVIEFADSRDEIDALTR